MLEQSKTTQSAAAKTIMDKQSNIDQFLDPLGDGISSLQLIRVSGSDVDISNAARVSYGKIIEEISDRDVKLINFLMEHNHTSPFEHNQLSFRVKCPMFVARRTVLFLTVLAWSRPFFNLEFERF